MAFDNLAAIILAAGKGTRMRSDVHKVLHPIGGQPMILFLKDMLDTMGVEKTVVVVGAERQQVEGILPGAEFAVQSEQLGTGHATYCAREALKGFMGDILILFGDVPMVSEETLSRLIEARRREDSNGAQAALSVLGFKPEDPAQYGRLVVNDVGDLEAIVEYKDASMEHLGISLCNSGIMAVSAAHLFDFLEEVGNENKSNEYYLTDIVDIARQKGHRVAYVEGNEQEVLGINSREDLSYAEAIFQHKMRLKYLRSGVTMVDPQSVYFSFDTEIEPDVWIGPNVYFGPGVKIETGARIEAFCHFEGCTVGKKAIVGPFARLRPAAEIGREAKVGNFVEVKKSRVQDGAKVNHLSYIGDADIGKNANIGAGTITCNYDGYNKAQTIIGDWAFIGSNTSLVAPVKIGRGAMVGAGSVVTENVPEDALAVTRAKQKIKEDGAKKFREKRKK